MREGGCLDQLARPAPVVRKDDVEEQQAAEKMGEPHGVTPDADRAEEQEKVPGRGVEKRLRHCQGENHQQAEVEKPPGDIDETLRQPLHRLRP
ncbi:hypothetical protein FQZ97_1036580 [compost metagenome]